MMKNYGICYNDFTKFSRNIDKKTRNDTINYRRAL